MAIIWDVKISNADVAHYRADLTFTRTDNVTNAVETYSFAKTIIETTPQRAALLDLVWAEHLKAAGQQTAIDAFITNLEQLGKSNLEARET